MNARRLLSPSLTRLRLAVALLLISLVPSSIGVAQTDAEVLYPVVEAVACPNCCISECYSGTWYITWQICVKGGNGSCMHCDTSCGIP